MRVLIADDDAVSRLHLQRVLTKLGHEVVETSDGQETWERFQAEPTPVVILDWIMPRVDGLEVCRMIRAEHRPRYTYVIMLTVLGGRGSYLEGMEAGADDFMTKPFDVDQLMARLRVAERILGLQAELRQLEGLLPICSYCRRIRDARSSWMTLERYVASRTETEFTHGICEDCYATQVKPQLAAIHARPA
ncbi:MAG TPA: response regulator transcription factor [Methylomirabilota bacterium]|nr:response regulator transcription factor [Methylomirabilota bacterium]